MINLTDAFILSINMKTNVAVSILRSGLFFRSLGFFAAFIIMCVSSLALAQNFARGYVTDDPDLRPGMMVALSQTGSEDNPKVERASQENTARLIGVTTDGEENLVTLASGEQQAYVQSSGTVKAFVSDVAGDIKKGDALTVSPIKGVMMRASEATGRVGEALEDFPRDNAESQTITSTSGDRAVLIGKMTVTLSNTLFGQPEKEDKLDKSQLEILGHAITGRDVGALQVVAALVIFIVVIVAEGAIIYGAVSSSIISLGRNPFSKGIIRSELFRVLGLAVIVLFIGLASIYAILSI